MSYYLKDPQSRVDYAIDWTPYLEGRTIADSAWSVNPSEAGGIAIDGASFLATRSAATLTGGRVGHVYSIANRVTLSDGRSEDRSIVLRVEQR